MFFVKTFNSEIRGFDVTEGSETLNSCLQKCLDSDYILCRSVEYDRTSSGHPSPFRPHTAPPQPICGL